MQKKKKKVVKLYSLLTVKISQTHTLSWILLFPALANLIKCIRKYFDNPSMFIYHDETTVHDENVCSP